VRPVVLRTAILAAFALTVVALGAVGWATADRKAAAPAARVASEPAPASFMARAGYVRTRRHLRITVRVWDADGRALRGARVTLVRRRAGGKTALRCGRTGRAGVVRCRVRRGGIVSVRVKPRGGATSYVRYWRP
jgi:hypothetical protein